MSVRHVVFWKLSATTTTQRDQQVTTIRESLTALLGRIDGLQALEVHPTAGAGQTWDLVLDSVFSDASALAAYLVHPLHEAAGQTARGMVVDRVAADYEIPPSAGRAG